MCIYSFDKILRTEIVHTSGKCFVVCYVFEQCRKLYLKHLHIYRKIQRFQIRYSKYQFITQNTSSMPKYISKKSPKIEH